MQDAGPWLDAQRSLKPPVSAQGTSRPAGCCLCILWKIRNCLRQNAEIDTHSRPSEPLLADTTFAYWCRKRPRFLQGLWKIRTVCADDLIAGLAPCEVTDLAGGLHTLYQCSC